MCLSVSKFLPSLKSPSIWKCARMWCLLLLLLFINTRRTLAGSGGYNALTAAHSASSIRAITDKEHDDSEPEKKPKSMLVISGGEGYIDFRIGQSKSLFVCVMLLCQGICIKCDYTVSRTSISLLNCNLLSPNV